MAPGLSQAQICCCFNQLFESQYRVHLRGGGVEPDYLPPGPGVIGQLIAREDFAASALHEAAHWCIAGASRRAQPDYGYVYLPPPRSALDQKRFFSSERRNQAVELYLSGAAGVPFRASADDPDLGLSELEAFATEVRALAALWEDALQMQGQDSLIAPQFTPLLPPPRAREFAAALGVARDNRLATATGVARG